MSNYSNPISLLLVQFQYNVAWPSCAQPIIASLTRAYKQAAASKAKVEAKKVVDPTKGMSLEEKKDYYEKALQEVRLEPVALVVRIENHTKIITMSLSQSRTLGKGRAEDCGRRAQNYGKGGGQRGQNCGQKS